MLYSTIKNIFHDRKISKIFDLKGSLKGRFTQQNVEKEKSQTENTGQEAQTSDARTMAAKHLDDKKGGQKELKKRGKDETSDTDTSPDGDSGSDEDDNSTLEQSVDGKSSQPSQDRVKKAEDDSDEGQDTEKEATITTLLDGDFLEFTGGRPLPLNDRAKAVFHMSILNVCAGFYLVSFPFHLHLPDHTSLSFNTRTNQRTHCSYQLSTFLITQFW